MLLNIAFLSVACCLISVVQRYAFFRLRNTCVLLDFGGGFVDGRAVLAVPSYDFAVFPADAFPL